MLNLYFDAKLMKMFYCLPQTLKSAKRSDWNNLFAPIHLSSGILSHADQVFEKGSSKTEDDKERDALFKKVGQLQLENDFTKTAIPAFSAFIPLFTSNPVTFIKVNLLNMMSKFTQCF